MRQLTPPPSPLDFRSLQKRVTDLGGKVSWFGYRDSDNKPIPGSGVYRINGNLAVARAVGDRSETPFVTAEPEVRGHLCTSAPKHHASLVNVAPLVFFLVAAQEENAGEGGPIHHPGERRDMGRHD